MREYQIRVLGMKGRLSLFYSNLHPGDAPAVAAGRKIAHGHAFEVWRGIHCVYPYEERIKATRPKS